MAGGINQKKVRREIHLARHHAYHNKRNVQNISKGKFIQKKMKYIILDEVWIMDGGKEMRFTAIERSGILKER